MQTYNNEEYNDLIKILINDAFYVNGVSYDTRIAQIRKYTEIIIRRLLNYPIKYDLTIGHLNTKKSLDDMGYTEALFKNALKGIQKPGNDRTHTKVTQIATEEEYNKAVENLFDLYGYMFYKFFKNYPFGSNMAIITAFSILPPIIRHITLNELYHDNPNDELIIDKFFMAKIKAFDKARAIQWTEQNKTNLEQIINPFSGNMYEICQNKAELLGNVLVQKGPLYRDFEEAVIYYKLHGIVEGNSEDVKEFNSLMEFVYIGRKEREREIELVDEAKYLIDRLV